MSFQIAWNELLRMLWCRSRGVLHIFNWLLPNAHCSLFIAHGLLKIGFCFMPIAALQLLACGIIPFRVWGKAMCCLNASLL